LDASLHLLNLLLSTSDPVTESVGHLRRKTSGEELLLVASNTTVEAAQDALEATESGRLA